MNLLTAEWVEKAEGDYHTAQREIRVRVNPNYDGVCFSSQQVVEKYLKAFLQERKTPFPKTHSLMDLLAICVGIDPDFALIQNDLNQLEGYGVQFRYPGIIALKEDAVEAFKIVKVARQFLRQKLDLK